MQSQSNPQHKRQWVESLYIRSLLAGAVAGTTTDLSLYPLDTLKTRLQSSQGFAAAGGFRGLFKGVGAAFVGSAPGAALFFVTYDSTKRYLLKGSGEHKSHGALSWIPPSLRDPTAHIVAGSLGELAACTVRVPTEVVKQRVQASQHPSSLSSLVFILSRWRHEGIVHVWKEMYRGWGITVMREVPFTIIQFPLWEGFKSRWVHRTREKYVAAQNAKGAVIDRNVLEEPISAAASAIFGTLSGSFAAAMTTPLDVMKTRLMLSKERRTSASVLKQVLREEGFRGLFSGLGPRVMWIGGGGFIFLGSYQWVINQLGGGE
ncbi:mitochondrial carrier [Eremomyces bilateralis CBS 781.70]|uniref:Mitochondrial carrier n=1 Tax=Eremomyces bilateralis CBS 781.70 TaxID=1392243 RepID=A0A6G1GFS4_9PEZI|nr:mitochondrial carrier [Eremomyces bilateralis CBS 781.70]KAF1816937.1 mitochondrial carrier [Eremomyces bilateralis CBS 781.70]